MQRSKEVQTVKHQVQIVISWSISLFDWFITGQLKQLCDVNNIKRPWYNDTYLANPDHFCGA